MTSMLLHDFHVLHDSHASRKTFMLFARVPRPGPPFTYAFPKGFHRVGASMAFRVPCVSLLRCLHDFHEFTRLSRFCMTFTRFTWFSRSGHPFTHAFVMFFHRVGASGALGVLFARRSRCTRPSRFP